MIVATHVTNVAPDTPHLPDLPDLPDLLSEAHDNLATHPTEVSVDAGFDSDANLDAIEQAGAEAFVATGRVIHVEWRDQQAPRGRIPNHFARRERMKRRLTTKAGRAADLKRHVTAEPVSGQILHTRSLRHAHHRGLEKVNAFRRFDCAIHTLLKLYRYGPRTGPAPGSGPQPHDPIHRPNDPRSARQPPEPRNPQRSPRNRAGPSRACRHRGGYPP